MKKVIYVSLATAVFLSGCSSVPMESKELTAKAKVFKAPALDNSGIYVYRKDTIVGAALKKDVLIDGECIGETAKGVFFYHEVPGDEAHTVSTESEFSNNELTINTDKGKLYFIEQYIKMGAFVGGAGIKQVGNQIGEEEVLKLNLAKKGNCGS